METLLKFLAERPYTMADLVIESSNHIDLTTKTYAYVGMLTMKRVIPALSLVEKNALDGILSIMYWSDCRDREKLATYIKDVIKLL